jgi:hypothetical protein
MTSAVLTTVEGEVLHGGSPKAKLTTVKAEVLHAGPVNARMTTLKAEVLHGGAVPARLTTTKAEVLYANAPANPFRRRCVIVVTKATPRNKCFNSALRGDLA